MIMGATGQLKLLLWKDFLVRRRHLGVATLVFGWAIAVFLILYIVRESVELEHYPTCQYTARSLPSTGLFPFVQSFICNVDNKCNNISGYEEVPQYKNARLTSVAKQLEGTFTNQTILNVIKSLPNMIVLLKAVGGGLDTPNLEGIFGPGVPISTLFQDPSLLKRELKQNNPKLDAEVVDDLFDASLKIGYLFKSVGSTDMKSSICDASELEKYLILEDPNNIEKVSEELCNMNAENVPGLMQNIFDHADFNGLLNMIGKTVDHFTNYSAFDDLKNMLDIFLGLNFMKENVPDYLKLQDWLPEIVPLLKNINRTYIDKNFITQSLQIIEPHFNETKQWLNYKNLILHITDLLISLQNKFIEKGPLQSQNNKPSPANFADLVTKIQTDMTKLKNPTEKDLQENQQTMFKILNDTLNILPVFYFNDSDPWLKIANIMDYLTAIIGNKYLSQISTISFLYSQGVNALQNTLKHEYGSEKIMYSLCEKHSNTVSTLFSLGPEFITNMLHCFGNISCTSIIVANQQNISQLFCDKQKIAAIMPPSTIKNMENLCNFELKPFLDDLISEFNLDWINKTVIETETRLKNFKNNSYDSFASAVNSTDALIEFVRNRKRQENEVSWEQLFPDFENTEWSIIANEAKRHSGLYMYLFYSILTTPSIYYAIVHKKQKNKLNILPLCAN